MKRGVTIIEVLFAIMVVAIGILGGLSLLTAAGRQAGKARTADASATSATAALADFSTREMNRPANWLAWNPVAGAYQPYAPAFGECICIDPRFVATNSATPADSLAAANFPFNDPGDATTPRAYMRRLTLDQMTVIFATLPNGQQMPIQVPSGLPMGKLLADSIFTFADDLNYDRDEDQSKVAGQVYDATTSPMRRQTKGELSWLATLTPRLERYGIIPTTEYVLSVVVFNQRPSDLAGTEERRVDVPSMPGGGVTGGEVLLSYTVPPPLPANPQEAADERLHIHTNDWILLAGLSPHTNPAVAVPGNPAGQVPVFQWYRVSDVEPDTDWNPATSTGQKYVTIAGRDWPATVTNTKAFILEGAVAVTERTIQLRP